MSGQAAVTKRTSTRWVRYLLLSILSFEAVGALIGGPILMVAPDLMKIPVSDLHGIFPSFFIPGLILTALGVLNASAFFVVLGRKANAWLWVGLALGGFLVWFIVEFSICGVKSWAQVAWGVPVLVGLIALWPFARR